MSIFSRLYAVVKTSDIRQISKFGLNVETVELSEPASGVVFSDDYKEVKDYANAVPGLEIISFNLKYISELNQNYHPVRLDEHHFEIVERIDPKYLTEENNGNLFMSLRADTVLSESKVFKRHYLYEKYGVTENLDPVIDYISTAIWLMYPYPASVIPKYADITELKDPDGLSYSFVVSDFPATLSWFDYENSSVIVNIRKYSDRDEYLRSLSKNNQISSGICSDIDFEKGNEIGLVVGSIQINLNDYGNGHLFLNNVELERAEDLNPFLRHEFNHLHKEIKSDHPLFSDTQNQQYNYILNLKNSRFETDYIKNITEILYIYGIWDESNANVEQYFTEHYLNKGQERSRTKLSELKNFLINFNPDYKDKVNIYLKFFNKCLAFYSLERLKKRIRLTDEDQNELFWNWLKKTLLKRLNRLNQDLTESTNIINRKRNFKNEVPLIFQPLTISLKFSRRNARNPSESIS